MSNFLWMAVFFRCSATYFRFFQLNFLCVLATPLSLWGSFSEPSERLIPRRSVQFSHSVVSDSSQPHELQHPGPPCPSQTPGVYSNSSSSSQLCHPAISSSVVPFSSCPQSLSASWSFPMSQLFT